MLFTPPVAVLDLLGSIVFLSSDSINEVYVTFHWTSIESKRWLSSIIGLRICVSPGCIAFVFSFELNWNFRIDDVEGGYDRPVLKLIDEMLLGTKVWSRIEKMLVEQVACSHWSKARRVVVIVVVVDERDLSSRIGSERSRGFINNDVFDIEPTQRDGTFTSFEKGKG